MLHPGVNLLLVFIPVSWGLHFGLPHDFNNRDTLVFFPSWPLSPLASLLAFATEDVSLRVGQTLAGLMSATLGNAVELIVSVFVQSSRAFYLDYCNLYPNSSSVIGSVLSNLLLVLGMCFFAGGLKYSEQGFGAMTTQINSSLLVIAVIAVLLPGAFSFSSTQANERVDILHMSHGVIYGGYLVFQLYSHATMYGDESGDIAKSTKYEPRKSKKKEGETDAEGGDQHENEEEEEEVEEPQMTTVAGIVLLVIVTVLVALTAEWLVDSIDGMTKSAGISKEFVGIILLPIVGNAAEHVTAITVSVKDKLNLSLQVAVGSSIQIALFVIPFIVTLAWIIGKPLSMLFDPYESIALFLAVITVNYVVQDGKSNWLEGLILMCLYVILAVTFWFVPFVLSTQQPCDMRIPY
ncbi:calcium/proton exchanger [Flagelloscypha sp. PMI_526]|nr:calcium/proton exchanger [Flagelloscypha sp. PMI_526]